MGPAFKHYMNPLHVYCRLRDLGVPKGAATFVCRFYEARVFNKYILKREHRIFLGDLGQPPLTSQASPARSYRNNKNHA
jgi:hypothetical protein